MTGWPLSEGRDSALLGLFGTGFLGCAPDHVAIAVSGGGDSMALLHMALRARAHQGWTVSAVTVDHGLRAESAAEAASVADFCATQGISHDTLRWQGPTGAGNLMDLARRARFSLMADWAKARGIGHVLLGHTADDDAESFVMNLARSAGIDGLSGMRRDWAEQGIHWHRPLLDISRADLRAYLVRNAVHWIDDPSNDNPRFTRVKARRALAALAPLGITVATLSETISNLADARQVVIERTAEAAAGMQDPTGTLRLSPETLAALPPEIARRLLAQVILWMGGAGYPPRGAQLVALQMRLVNGEDSQLGGVLFQHRKGMLHITREPRATMAPVPLGALWDHRWQIIGPADPACQIAALGPEGLRLCPDWRAHGPRAALIVSPAVWRQGRLISAPLAGFGTGYSAMLSQGFIDFILSH